MQAPGQVVQGSHQDFYIQNTKKSPSQSHCGTQKDTQALLGNPHLASRIPCPSELWIGKYEGK